MKKSQFNVQFVVNKIIKFFFVHYLEDALIGQRYCINLGIIYYNIEDFN